MHAQPDPAAERALRDRLAEIQQQVEQERQPERQVDPQHVINSYRQRTADLEFELYKRDALIAQLTAELEAARTEIDNLRVMHADEPEPSEQGA